MEKNNSLLSNHKQISTNSSSNKFNNYINNPESYPYNNFFCFQNKVYRSEPGQEKELISRKHNIQINLLLKTNNRIVIKTYGGVEPEQHLFRTSWDYKQMPATSQSKILFEDEKEKF